MNWDRLWIANSDHIREALEEGAEVELHFAEPLNRGSMGLAEHDLAEWLMAYRGMTPAELVKLVRTGDFSDYWDDFANAWADAATNAAMRETVDAGW